MVDRTTKLLLAAIALGLFADAAGRFMPVALADTTSCRIDGPVEVRITDSRPIEVRLSDIGEAVKVEWGFSQPGSSSSSPLYVRQTQ
ncbi:MAG: hypothetical protein KC621_04685 [Myxococcales bacterium]|nr:hypothetical protein [Myxococcales bacterium]